MTQGSIDIRHELPTDVADLFIHLVAEFDVEVDSFVVTHAWMLDEGVQDIADLLEGAALYDGEIDPERVAELLDVPDEDDYGKRLFSILLGLDRALIYANPYFGNIDQGALTPIALRWARTGRLNSGTRLGALLPRCSFPGRKQYTRTSLNEVFVGVVWIPEEDWERTTHGIIPPKCDFTRIEREAGLTVTCVPFTDDINDFKWRVIDRPEGRFFSAGLEDDPAVSRLPLLLEKLDASGAHVAFLPELTLTQSLRATWQELVRDSDPPEGSQLKWLIIGSGNACGLEPPMNRCVMLDRVTGEVILEQDKIYPFTLTSDQLAEWNLSEILGSEPVEEDLTSGRSVVVTESRIGRLAVLVCEDLARLFDLGPGLRAHGISHIFAPVFSKETKPHHWEHAKAKEYAQEVGTLVVVANSLAVARHMGEEGPVMTALAHSPYTTQVRHTVEWDDAPEFRIDAGDPVPLSAQEAYERLDDDHWDPER